MRFFNQSAIDLDKESDSHDFINADFHIRQRAIIALLMIGYLLLSPHILEPFQNNILNLTIGSLYLSFQPLTQWAYQKFAHRNYVTRFYITADLLFASYCYLIDTNPTPVGLAYLFVATITNGCQHGPYFYQFTLRHAYIALFLTSVIHFSLLVELPSFAWLIEILLFLIGIYALNFLYFQIDEIKSHIRKDHEIDPLTGMMHRQAFLRAAHIALEIRSKQPSNMVLMLIEVSKQSSPDPEAEQQTLNKKPKLKHKLRSNGEITTEVLGEKHGDIKAKRLKTTVSKEALKHFAKLLHINLKPDDLICRYQENLFAILLTHSGKEDAEATGLSLQHEFTLWTEKGWSDKANAQVYTSIAICSVPYFSVTVELLLKHTYKWLQVAKRRLGSPGITLAPELTSKEVANS